VLILQDPTNEQGPYLLESLTHAFRSASQIRGIFAFASSAGVRLFADDEEFKGAARRGTVDLIVGTDAVTNVRALDALATVATRFSTVTVRAFLNPKPEGLFHPKFCFTKKGSSAEFVGRYMG
jgi:hypothetical protein